MHYDTSLYSAGCKEKIWGRILKHCVLDEIKSIQIFLSKISTPFLTYFFTFVIIKAEFWYIE